MIDRRWLHDFGILAFAVFLALASPARAEPCGENNLLAARSPSAWTAIYRPQLATDGVLAQEGDPSNASLSTMLGPGASLVWDLGVDTAVSALLVQASAEARLAIDISEDGVGFRGFWESAAVATTNAGLRARMATGLEGHGRYLRLRPMPGQGPVAIAEVQAFCRKPAALDVKIQPAVEAPAQRDLVKWQAWRKIVLGFLAMAVFALLWPARRAGWFWAAGACGNLAGALAVYFTFGIAGFVTFAVLVPSVEALLWVRLRRTPRSWQALVSAAALAPLVLASALAYTNFGRWSGYYSVHYHDAAHYFLGAKYAPELGYTRLYSCLAVAAQEEGRWPAEPSRVVRDLRNNTLVPLAAALDEGKDCAGRFGTARWAEFRRDTVFFQSQLHPAAWSALLADHGYNATPGWTFVLRTLLLRDRPASIAWLSTLSHLDEVGLVLLALVLLWGFGLRVGTLALLVIGLGFPWITLWTGGGIGRSLWLLFALAGLATYQRGHPRLAGVLVGLSAGLQIFPALLLAGPFFSVVADRWRRRPPNGANQRLLLSASCAFLALAVLSLYTSGPSLWLEFAHNSGKHMASTSANRIGLGQVSAVWHLPAPLAWTASLVLLALWGRTLWHQRADQDRTTLSVCLPLFIFNLSSYYLAVLAGAAPRLASPRRSALALAIVVVLPQAAAYLAPGVPGQVYYAGISLLFLAGAAAWLWTEMRSARALS